MGVLEGKESGDPTVPVQGFYRNGRTGGYHHGPGPCSWPRDTLLNEKSRSSKKTRDKVRRWFTLLVTARVGGTTGKAPTLLVVLAAVVVRNSFSKGQRQRLSRQKIIKCLM